MDDLKIDPVFELFSDLSKPPKQQTKEERAASEFEKIFKQCQKALKEKRG